jgi:hypothetical protein
VTSYILELIFFFKFALNPPRTLPAVCDSPGVPQGPDSEVYKRTLQSLRTGFKLLLAQHKILRRGGSVMILDVGYKPNYRKADGDVADHT